MLSCVLMGSKREIVDWGKGGGWVKFVVMFNSWGGFVDMVIGLGVEDDIYSKNFDVD